MNTMEFAFKKAWMKLFVKSTKDSTKEIAKSPKSLSEIIK